MGGSMWSMGWGLAVALLLAARPASAGEAPWVAPPEAKARKNPVARAEGLREGKKAYDTNCAVCHGATGKGDGPGAAALNPKPKNLADKEIQDQTDGELFWKISKGRGVMPPWEQFPEKDRWSLVHYLRSLAPKK